MPHAQTDVALRLVSSFQSRNLLSIRHPPILGLPVELTSIIFDYCGSGIKARLDLSHTCRHWMSIMSKSNALWTDIQIIANHLADSRQFSNLISLLDMQLDRAAGRPLDVSWELNQPLAYHSKLMDLLRQKGPFSQWRTLRIRVQAPGHDYDDGANIFHPGDAFSNLESITIIPSFWSSIFRLLNCTTTSKLQVLDYCPTGSPREVTLSDCTDMVRRIYHLKTTSFSMDILSSNITHLDATYQASHKFPHLTTYKITACTFTTGHQTDLRCLKTLKISALLIVRNTEVSLPVLRHLTCGTVQLQEGAKMIAPLLESMRITGDISRGFNDTRSDYTGEATKNERFLSSPSHSLTVESALPFDTILKLLEQSPLVERVSLGFSDDECAMQVLERIGATSDDNSEETRLCGRLRELRLSFLWEKCDVESWMRMTFLWDEREVESWEERAARVVKMRMRSGIVLQIYATWKGEGTYVLLA